MADMEVTVGLRREAGVHGVAYALRQILIYDHFYKISGFRVAHLSNPCLSCDVYSLPLWLIIS